MLIAYQKEVNIIQGLKIGAIVILFMGKLFQDYKSVDSYCQPQQNAYIKIISKQTNNNDGYN